MRVSVQRRQDARGGTRARRLTQSPELGALFFRACAPRFEGGMTSLAASARKPPEPRRRIILLKRQAPLFKRRRSRRQHAQSSWLARWAGLGAAGLAGLNRFVGDRFVGVAGQVDTVFIRISVGNHRQPRPAVVNCTIDQKLESDITSRRVVVPRARTGNDGSAATKVKQLAWHLAT